MKKLFWFLAILFIVPQFSLAATANENFDSYISGASLDGANGGIGWSSAWAVEGGTWTSDTAPIGGQGGLALHTSTTVCCNPNVKRTFAPISAGTLHFRFNLSDAEGAFGHTIDMILQDSANTGDAVNTNRITIRFNGTSGGSVDAGDGQGTESNVGTFVASTWGTIDVKFDNTLGSVFQVSVNGGPYSTDIGSGGSLEHIDTLLILSESTSLYDFWIDDISIAPPVVTGTGTINRLAKFISGTSIGNALFSDDGTHTTLTSGNLFLQIGSAIDSATNGVLNFGTTLATTMNFGRTGQKMIINSDVGIGTAAPTQKLDVNGGIFSNFLHLLAGGLGIDTDTAGELALGSTTATSIKVGRTGIITTVPGTLSLGNLTTTVNCNSSASPALCDGAPSGSVALPNGGTTLTVNTTAVTANSQIFIQEDQSLGSRLGITCNTGTGRNYVVSSRVPGTSFTVKSSNAPVINKACLIYWVVN